MGTHESRYVTGGTDAEFHRWQQRQWMADMQRRYEERCKQLNTRKPTLIERLFAWVYREKP